MRRLAALALLTPLLLPGAAWAGPPPTTGDVVLVVQDGSIFKGNADLTDYDYDSANVATVNGSSWDGFRPSADGTRFTYALSIPDFHGHTTSRVVVRDAGGRLVRYLDRAVRRSDDLASGATVGTPALSPDGSQVVYTMRTSGGTYLRVGRIATATAGVRYFPNSTGLTSPVPLTNDLLCLALRSGTIVSVTPLGTKRDVKGLPPGSVTSFAVSSDGTRIAYVHVVPGGRQLSIATLASQGYPYYAAGPSTLLVAKHIGREPSFSHDGTTVYWSQGSEVWSVPATGGTASQLTHDGTSHDQSNVLGVTLDDGTAPGPVTEVRADLGSHPTLHWTLPADTDLSGVSIVRTPDSPSYATPQVRYVPAPLTSWTDTLPAGDTTTTYHYTLTTVDRSGHVAPTKGSVDLQLRTPDVRFTQPTSLSSHDATFPVQMPVGRYDLDVSDDDNGTYTRIITGGSGSFVFGRDAGTVSQVGHSYRFAVRVYDEHGNSTPLTHVRPAVVPYDDASFTYAGTTSVLASMAAFLGSEHVLGAGATATFRQTASLVLVVGAHCRTCGILDVFVNGSRYTSVNLRSPAGPAGYHHDGDVLAALPLGRATFTIRLQARGGNAIVDGLAFRR